MGTKVKAWNDDIYFNYIGEYVGFSTKVGFVTKVTELPHAVKTTENSAFNFDVEYFENCIIIEDDE
jgi:hypothetical protein